MGLVKVIAIFLMVSLIVLALGLLGGSIGLLVKYSPPYAHYTDDQGTCSTESTAHESQFKPNDKEKYEQDKYCQDNNLLRAAGDCGIIAALFLVAGAASIFLRNPRFSAAFLILAFIFAFIAFLLPFFMRSDPSAEDPDDLCRYVVQYKAYVTATKEYYTKDSPNTNNWTLSNPNMTTPEPIITTKGPPPVRPKEPVNHVKSNHVVKIGNSTFHFEHGLYACWKGGAKDFFKMSPERIQNSAEARAMHRAAIGFMFFAALATVAAPLVAACFIFYAVRNARKQNAIAAEEADQGHRHHHHRHHGDGEHRHRHRHQQSTVPEDGETPAIPEQSQLDVTKPLDPVNPKPAKSKAPVN